MAYFYGMLQGNRGEATRVGTKTSGVTTYTASWEGAVRSRAYIKDGKDYVTVELVPWRGAGSHRILYEGPISGRRR